MDENRDTTPGSPADQGTTGGKTPADETFAWTSSEGENDATAEFRLGEKIDDREAGQRLLFRTQMRAALLPRARCLSLAVTTRQATC